MAPGILILGSSLRGVKGQRDGGDRVLLKFLWRHSLCPSCSHSSIETCGTLQLRDNRVGRHLSPQAVGIVEPCLRSSYL